MSDLKEKQVQPQQEEQGFEYSQLKWEDWLVLIIFWALCLVVFLQFFSRYALNAAIIWTEEMARYLLISVGFLGSAIAARKRAHIYMEAGYRFFPPTLGFLMSTLVDIIKIIFFGMCSYLSFKILPIMDRQRMVTLPIPMSVLYGIVCLGFVLMTLRSLQIAWVHWKKKYIPVVNEK
ncbi:MAG: TRAP transporter small permease [Spirochaetales bacterium]